MYVEAVLNAPKRERLQEMLHQSPLYYDKDPRIRTPKLLAKVCQEQELSETKLSAPTLLDAVAHFGALWQWAKHWVVSLDPLYTQKIT